MPANPASSTSRGRTNSRIAVTVAVLLGAGGVVTVGPSSALADGATTGVAGHAPATAAPRPVSPAVRSISLPALSSPDRGAGEARLVSAPTTTRPFRLVALTWAHASAPAKLVAEVRVRREGAWSSWQPLEFDPSEGPAPGEDTSVRDGTAALWVGQADGVQARVSAPDGSSPKDVRVVVIEPGTSSYDRIAVRADQSAATGREAATTATLGPGAGAVTSKPRVITRHQWGADASLGDQCWSPRYGSTVKAVLVHHTVGSNSYAPADGPAIVRGIHAYHTQAMQWCDIGYNFLVDRYGTVYQGRRGGIGKPVRGSHSGDFNVNTTGISLMGDFSTQPTTAAMRAKLVHLIAWRLSSSYRSPISRVRVNGHGFARISGHRDAMATACPGQRVYEWLPRLRSQVADLMGDYHSPVYDKWMSERERGKNPGAVFVGEQPIGNGRYTIFQRGRIYWSPSTRAHALSGPILRRFSSFGGPRSQLGFPTSDIRTFIVPGGSRADFAGGRIYWSHKGGARPVYGAILRRYLTTGGAGGKLGMPTTTAYRIGEGRRQNFVHGRITWIAATDKTVVTDS